MIVYIESLGCSRNQVDSELMMGKLSAAGHIPTDDPARARAIIVNTCSFIDMAAQEAVDTILSLARFKQEGACRRLVVAGCLAQRYKDDPDLAHSLPEVDAFMGTAAVDHVVSMVEGGPAVPLRLFPDPDDRGFPDPDPKRIRPETCHAFVKVSEGCNRHCTFCVIPKLRGRQRSRPLADICDDAESLVAGGVKEIILTAENTTDYGMDKVSSGLGDGTDFAAVLAAVSQRVASVDPLAWVRFLYGHPGSMDRGIVRTARDHDNICGYYDIPVQHADTDVLRRMGRPYRAEDLTALFGMIRQVDPSAVLRTTVMVGFPGETDTAFDALHTFIQAVRFDHLGVFVYSDADDIASHALPEPVPKAVAEERADMLMTTQAAISSRINQAYVGKVLPVRVTAHQGTDLTIGRTMFQAPEVDGETLIENNKRVNRPAIGSLVQVQITDAFDYDISGVVL